MYSRGLFFCGQARIRARARERCPVDIAQAHVSTDGRGHLRQPFFFFGGDRRGLPIGRNAKATACLRDVGAMEDDAHAGRERRVWWEVLLAQVRKVSSSSGLQMIRVPQDASLLAKMHALNAFPLA